MQLSCLPVSLYGEFAAGRTTLSDWFRTARALGLDGADISVAHVASRAPAYLRDLRAQADAAGLPIVMLATYSDFSHPDAAERARQVEDLRAWIEVGAQLGVTFLRVTAGQNYPELEPEAALQWVADGLVACLPEARAAGVRLLYENHVRGAPWQYNDFTQPAARFLEVVRRTEGSGLELLFDTANCLALHDDPEAVLRQVIGRVGAVHLSDIKRAGAFEPTVLGTGAAPIPALLRQLAAHGFAGWFSIEEASRTGDEGLRQAVAYARTTWQAGISGQ